MGYTRYCPVSEDRAEALLEMQAGYAVCPLCDDGLGYGKIYLNEHNNWAWPGSMRVYDDIRPWGWCDCDMLEVKDWIRHQAYPHHCRGCERDFCNYDPADLTRCDCQTCGDTDVDEDGQRTSYSQNLRDMYEEQKESGSPI